MSYEANRSFYDRIASSYDLIAHASEWDATRKGLELLNVQAGETVLEIGYGTGHALKALASSVGSSGKVFGVDISEKMREVALKELGSAANQVDLQVGQAPPLDYPDQGMDAVFLSFTLELFPDHVLPEILEEVRRVLKPGGRCGVVSMAKPSDPSHESLLEKGYVWMHQHFPHVVDCRPLDVADVLRKAGFEVLEHESMEIWTLPVAAVVARKSA